MFPLNTICRWMRWMPALFAVTLWAQPLVPRFRAVTVDTNVAIGYGVTVADVDGDGGRDLVLCDAKQIAWYRHPNWEKPIT